MRRCLNAAVVELVGVPDEEPPLDSFAVVLSDCNSGTWLSNCIADRSTAFSVHVVLAY